MAIERSGLATPEQVAEFLRSTPNRLAKQRITGGGPAFIKDGRRVLYRWADIDAYLEANTRERTDTK